MNQGVVYPARQQRGRVHLQRRGLRLERVNVCLGFSQPVSLAGSQLFRLDPRRVSSEGALGLFVCSRLIFHEAAHFLLVTTLSSLKRLEAIQEGCLFLGQPFELVPLCVLQRPDSG